MQLSPTNPDTNKSDYGIDPINLLTNAFLEAARGRWTKQECNRILFCEIGDIRDLKDSDDTHEGCKLFLKNECDFQIPVIYVSFCGNILKSKIGEDYNWLEIGNYSDKILCRADPVTSEDIEKVKNGYYSSHQLYRNKEEEYKTSLTIENKIPMEQSCLLWQLDRRSKDIYEKLNQIQIRNDQEIKNKKVMVVVFNNKIWIPVRQVCSTKEVLKS